MTDFDIHPTSLDHVPALQQVVTQTDLFPSEMLPDLVASSLNGDSASLWLSAMQAGEAVGLCFAEPEAMAEGVWNMRALAVLPNLQGQGAGKALVTELEGQLRNRGVRLLLVDTSGAQAFGATRAFYRGLDYEQEAVIRDYWAPGDDKVTFRKTV